MNNLKQLGLAMHNHHDALSVLPPGMRVSLDGGGNDRRCWFQYILPYVEQDSLQRQIEAWLATTTPPNGGKLWWATGRQTRLPTFMCPSDPLAGKIITSGIAAEVPSGYTPENSQGFHGNYAVYAGDTVFNPPAGVVDAAADPNGERLRGLFFSKSRVRITDITDGS